MDTVHLAEEFPDARLILAHCAISDLVVAVARAAAPAERVHRHGVVEPGGPDRDVLAVPARQRRVGERLALRPAAGRRRADDALRVPGRAVRGAGARRHGRAGRAHARRRGPARPRAAARAGRSARSIRCSTASSPTSRRRWAAPSPASTSPSRSRSRGSPARSARTATSRRSAARCSELLDDFDEHIAPPEEGRPIPAAARLLVFALIVARTPDVPLPDLPDAPAPTRAEAEAARTELELAVFAAADLGRRGRGARRGRGFGDVLGLRASRRPQRR